MDRLTPEAGMQYVCHFSLAQRASAIGLLRQGNQLSASNVLKALCFGRVIIAAETMKQLQSQRSSLCEEKRFLQSMSVKRISTTLGVDPVRKRGVAQDYKRQLVVRTWPFKTMPHPGHAALSIKDMTNKIRMNHLHRYLSWWGSDKPENSLFNKFFQALGLDIQNTSMALPMNKYASDKQQQISEQTNARLICGTGDKSGLYTVSDDLSESDLEYAKNNPLQPRARQVRLRNSYTWGVQANKVYLPPMGDNSYRNSKKFCYFGLSEHRVVRFTMTHKHDAMKNKATYGFLSRKKSCSGKILESLKAGGAGWYTSLKNYVLLPKPDDVHKVAIKMQQRVDALNAMTETLTATSKQWSDAQGDHPTNCASYAEELRAGITLLKNSPLKKQAKKLQKVIAEFERFESVESDLVGYQPLDALSLDSFMPKAIRFVEGFHKAWHLAKTDAERRALQPAFGAFAFMKSTIERLHRLDSPEA